MFKERLKGYIAGFLTCIILSSTLVVWANPGNIIEVFYGVNVEVNGVQQNFSNEMRPFISGGVTFLPVRGISEALGVPVEWDGSTSTVIIGSRTEEARPPQPTTREVPLISIAYLEVGNIAPGPGLSSRPAFSATGTAMQNHIRMSSSDGRSLGNGRYAYQNHVVYPLNMAVSFRATLHPPHSNNQGLELVYRIYGDNRLLYTSPIMTHTVAPIPIDVNVSGHSRLRIGLHAESNSRGGLGLMGAGERYRGIENATLVVFD